MNLAGILGLVIGLALVGILILVGAWLMALDRKNETSTRQQRAAVLSSAGGGLLTGAAAATGVLFLEQVIDRSQEAAEWRSAVATAAEVPGFAVRHSLHEPDPLVFNGKRLTAAELDREDLHGLKFRDANLVGAHLNGADLRGAVLIGADLSFSELRDAQLDGAQLMNANFTGAAIEGARSLHGAQVNSQTKWPCGFLTSRQTAHLVRQLEVVRHTDPSNKSTMTAGSEVCE